MAGKFQGEVGLHAGIHVARAAFVDIPATILELAAADVGHALFLDYGVNFIGPVHEQHVIRAERAIDEKFAAPVAIGMLQTQQVLLRPADSRIQSILRRPRLGICKYHSHSLS